MIMINGNWEQVKDLSDIIKIVNENIGYEFARKVEEICGEPNAELEDKNCMLENKINNLESTQEKLRQLFIEVLNLAVEEQLSDEKADELLNEFDVYIEN